MKKDWAADRIERLAGDWMAERRGGAGDDDVGTQVVLMNFTASAATQWAFIRACIESADTEKQYGAIAAGPLEHLMGHFGADYIDAVEALAAENPTFRVVLEHMWQYSIDDDIWARLQLLGVKAP